MRHCCSRVHSLENRFQIGHRISENDLLKKYTLLLKTLNLYTRLKLIFFYIPRTLEKAIF